MPVTLELHGNRIYLTSDYPTAGIGKTVPGANFSTTGGPHWSVPLNIEACLALRERFGGELRIDSSLSAWYRKASAERERLHALAMASDGELKRLPRVAPDLAAAMERRTYQRSGTRFAADARNVLIADDPGLGKTLIGMGSVVENGVSGPYLVVCPKTAVLSVWARELPRWLRAMKPTVVTVPDGRAKRDAILDRVLIYGNAYDGQAMVDTMAEMERVERSLSNTWVVVHPEMVRTKSWWVCKQCKHETPRNAKPKELACGHDPVQAPIRHDHEFPQLFGVDWGAVICDESDRAIIRLTGTPTQVRNGMELLPVREDGMRVAMSGTPFRGKPHLLWSTLNWLDPKKHGGKWRWVMQFWKTGGYSGYEIGDFISPEHEAKLWESLKGVMLRRTKAEVAPDLPPKAYVGSPIAPDDPASPVGIWLPMETKQAKAYKEMLNQTAAELDGGRLEAIGELAIRTRLQQFATSAGRMVGTEFKPALPSNKFDWLAEALLEWGFPDDPCTKVIVASQYTQTLKMFADGLLKLKDGRTAAPVKSLLLTGEVSGAARAGLIDRFNDSNQGPHVMFLQVKTGGVAITIDTADKMVLIDEGPVDVMIQVEDRIHRVSKPRPVEYYYLRSEGTVDVGIAMVNAQRGKDSRRLLDERRGVEYLRRVLELSR